MTSAQQNDRAAIPEIPLTEDRPGLPPGDQSIGALVKDATTHLSTLVRAEIELARLEISRDVKRGVRGSIFFVIALTVVLFSLFFFFIAIAEMLADFGLLRSVSYGIVFVGMLLFAGLFGYLGYKKVRGIKGPKRTISTMRDNASVLKRDGDENN